jgi:hypothetical protein
MQRAQSQNDTPSKAAQEVSSHQLDELLTEQSAAQRLHPSVKTLQAWRVRGFGPAFVRLGRRVLYRTSSLQRFIEVNTFTSTSEADRHRS